MDPEAGTGLRKYPSMSSASWSWVALLTASMTEATDESREDSTFVAFFQAVFGLSMDPKEANDESESVSMIAKVLSPILEMLLMEDFRSKTEAVLYIELHE